MGSMLGLNPPTPPNPIATAGAQTSTNVGTALANSYLNNVNQTTPSGSLSYNVTGNYPFTDPATGQVYNIPRWTAAQTQSGISEQGTADINWRNQASQYNLADTAKNQTYFLRDYLQTQPGDYLSSAPGRADVNSLNVGSPATTFADVGDQQRSLGDTGQQQTGFGDVPGSVYGFGDAGNITRSYGTADDFATDRSNVENALFGRLQPQLDKDRSRLEQQLADQGIRYGSTAYNDAMDNFNRQSTDARLAVTAQGGQEQKLQSDIAAQKAGFQNAAQMQAFQQAQSRGTFFNTAQQQEFAEAAKRGDFANAAQAQQFQEALQSGTFANQAQKDAYQQAAQRGEFANASMAQDLQQRNVMFNAENQNRNQYLTEQYQARNQPINEINSLMSGSQVSAPNWVNTNSTTIPTTDIAGLVNNRFSQDLSNYQQSSANFNSLMGGIFGALGGIGKGVASDRRIKDDVDKIGTIFAAGPDGEKDLPIYEYSYKADPTDARHVGPMAQDVEKIDRGAVFKRGGVKHIDMTRMGSILKAA